MTMTQTNVRAPAYLICDCDGVLIDSESVALRALIRTLGPHVPHLSPAALEEMLEPRLGMNTLALLDELQGSIGLRLSDAELASVLADVEHDCATQSQPVPGIANLLATVPQPKAVASNSSRPRIEASLVRAGLRDVFGEHIYSAYEMPQPKPAPDVYLAACAGLGAAPAHCLAIEDSDTGVRAARAAGLTVFGFAGVAHAPAVATQRLLAAGARYVFTDMRALADALTSTLAAPA
ncbi:Phosphoglycolate phosphatase [Ralstonia mannitolilytica]|uniref:Phosphoglycolate phosphatase n=2 Tax=Ralstonia mannitolilytica TaxID=105219 RepID=A0AAD2AUC3_9RALS|nr:Phosphoglycolate phosphatase [Ralstonia mannitolilytica]CAJ0704648.1 Phosphoglycolate phosphatase [Ralstonia mannitolilytica]CAJ0718662.1 Phosphoglycolate phosphatase [Ralstonia mannitolilytica]CAJ0881706.1 Phosphoglycolate phosphatase [Ralstonia mannitolilytica]CAJ0883642.1 Phosphoglycolate phosphatase [Ralstonia mannitolilytica]